MESIAHQKYTERIGEYLLYMYQMEDLIRSYHFNLEDIRQYVVSQYPVSEEEKAKTMEWFGDLCSQMIAENIERTGHLAYVQKHVDQLAELHWQLLKTDREYFALYQDAKPHVVSLVLEAGTADPGHEIQVCVHALYGLLLSRLYGKEVPESILEGSTHFGKVLQYLDKAYIR
ncbi:hypothetical protein ADIS_1815 [Lunatimonas lonarensis]|uniref:Uncharacterized protein n=1 Tax=Lunatimonas lonarensis TaxID=1232681 RepID=R7ZTY6_9BACT|nr:DUF4924 family protein [Lunatimonas lonarensis]EON77596.1 hypothetical protein ADIS_1815 [Lunatimonas lonarensis]